MDRMGREVVYICGKLLGRKDRLVMEAAEELLRRKGYEVLTPRSIPADVFPGGRLPICLAMIEAADVMYMMDGAQEDKRCRIEEMYAVYQGVEVINSDELGGEEG